MPKVELYINLQLCDLTGSEQIEVDYTSFDISKIGSRGGARSYSFNLPKTNRNKAVLENPEIVNNLSTLPYTRLPCRILVDGIDVQIRFAEIESAKDVYSVRVYGANSDLFVELKDLFLSDIDLSEFDHFWNITEIADRITNTTGEVYPVIDTHEDSPNFAINNDNRTLRCDFLLTAVFINTLLEKIITQSGYTYSNEITSDSENLLIPYNGRKLIRNKDYRRYESTFTQTIDALTTIAMPPSPFVSYGYWITFNSQQNSDRNLGEYWQHGNYQSFPFGGNTNQFLRFAENTKFTVEFSLTFAGDGIDLPTFIFFTTNFTNIIDSSQITDLTYHEVSSGNTTNDWNISGEFEMETGDYTTWLSSDDDKNCLMIFCPRQVTTRANSYIRIKNVEILESGELRYINDYQQKNYLTVAELLPNMTQGDLLKAYMQMFCLLPTVNNVLETVSLIKFSTLVSKLHLAYDWSDKLDYTEPHEVKFVSNSYGQRNLFNYLEDGNEIKPVGTDGILYIENRNLELEKTIVELPFASTVTNKRLIENDVCQIGCFKDGLLSNEKVPRILNNDSIDLGGDLSLTDLTDTEVISGEFPLPYFIKSGADLNLGFDDNLLPTYYTLFQ